MHEKLTHSVDDLRDGGRRTVYLPADAGYDEARAAWNLVVDQHPAAVLMAESAGDIQAGIQYARRNGLDVMLQATGHGVIRPADGALLINTSRMNGVSIDPDARIAWIEAGATWGQVLPKAQEHGLAPLLGSSPGVGAVAYTLGGGAGWLARKYGLACDSVNRFEVVTAEGEKRTVSPDENPDLFWGLRGGGGALAAVTGMEVRLFPVDTVLGGSIVYPAALAGKIFREWRQWIRTVPEELTTSVKIINFPDMDIVPEPMRGQTFVMVSACYAGPVEEGATLMEHWTEWQEPVMNLLRPMPFSDVAEISQDPADPMPSFVTGAWVRELTDDAIEAMVRYATLQEAQLPLIFLEVRHLGGAVTRQDENGSAFGHRDAELLLELVGLAPAPPVFAALTAYADQLKAELAPALTGTVYMNFLEGEESVARVRDGFTPEKFARLVELKAKYDPDHVFNRAIAIPTR